MARAQKDGQQRRANPAGRIPPQNLEAEESVLGGLLVDPESINKIVDLITAEDFYKDAHGRIYDAMVGLYEKNEPIDLVTVSSSARDKGILDKIGGATYLNKLVDTMPSAANIIQYAKMVREKALLRNLMNVATEIVDKGFDLDVNVDGYIDDAEKMIFQVSERKFRPSFYSVKDIVMDNVKIIERLYEKKQTITGVPTGFAELDKMTSGLQPSDLVVIAGRPSMGKTALSMNIAQYVATLREDAVPVGIFSMEMSKEQLVTRLLSSESDVDHL